MHSNETDGLQTKNTSNYTGCTVQVSVNAFLLMLKIVESFLQKKLISKVFIIETTNTVEKTF